MKKRAFLSIATAAAAILVCAGTAAAQTYDYGSYGYGYPSSYSQYGLGYGYGDYDPSDYYSPYQNQYQYQYNPYPNYWYEPCTYDQYGYGYNGNCGYDYNNYGYGSSYYCYYYPSYPGCTQNQNESTLSITNVSGPTSLTVGQAGTWSITTSAPSSAYLSVSVTWGDEAQYGYGVQAQSRVTGQTTFTHTYQTPGTYTITFTATDSFGHSDTATRTVVVGGGQQGGQFSASPVSGAAPLSVTFSTPITAAQANGTFAISYGDGQYGTLQWSCATDGPGGCFVAGQHTYQSPGTYTAAVSYTPYCTPGLYCGVRPQEIGTATVTVYGQVGCYTDQYGRTICY